MLELSISNLDVSLAEIDRDKLISASMPPCVAHIENLESLKTALHGFEKYRNLLIIGNGGSIWSFMAYWTALADRIEQKRIYPLTDMEPDYLRVIKNLCPIAESLVIVISKSGSTVGVIENIFAFWDYPMLFVTDPAGPIGEIAHRREAHIIPHAPVGGRYSGFSASAYVPAWLTGIDIDAIESGGREGYRLYGLVDIAANPALQLAAGLWQLEREGYHDIFLPIYSNFLQTFGMVVTQLFHESFGKNGLGLTVLAVQAPESQHHTNQRYFGGRKDMIGCFLQVGRQKDEQSTISVPEEYTSLPLRDGSMGDLNGIALAKSFASEYIGTVTDAKHKGMPLFELTLERVTPAAVGELMAFWHYVTIYSSLLRAVDPYDQPQVEDSKVISFRERLK